MESILRKKVLKNQDEIENKWQYLRNMREESMP